MQTYVKEFATEAAYVSFFKKMLKAKCFDRPITAVNWYYADGHAVETPKTRINKHGTTVTMKTDLTFMVRDPIGSTDEMKAIDAEHSDFKGRAEIDKRGGVIIEYVFAA